MPRATDHLRILDTMLSEAVGRGLLQRRVEDAELDGRSVTVDGKRMINFGSCSYLGLETDERLKNSAIEAVRRYGTQFSSSRAYLSAPPYAELELLFEQIFDAPALVAPTTTLAHLSALPVLVGEDDAVLLDQQVHHSVQVAANQLRLQKTHVELVRHNDLRDVEARVVALGSRHERVWYLADGVYSMYGDLAPFDDLAGLLARHPRLHLYIDDAHAMSWTGVHGRGLARQRLGGHPRVVVATSLAKGFGAGGGVVVLPNAELLRQVRTMGGPMIFSGPIQPATLGAAIASARLHLTDEIHELQAQLAERTRRCHELLLEHGLPVQGAAEAPIHFVGLGLPRVTYNMVRRLLDDGFYVNTAMFPAVPMKRSGVRFTTTLHQTPRDIEALVGAIARHFPKVLEEEGTSASEIQRLFPGSAARPQPAARTVEIVTRREVQTPELQLEHHTTIQALDAGTWNGLLGDRGTFTWQGLRDLEAAFSGQPDAENNWNFHYYVVRDAAGRVVLATFFTDALWKDDMLSSAALSRAVEARRTEDPYFLTSRYFAMGCLLTEGDHLYLDRNSDWRAALRLLLEAATREQERAGANTLVLRDLPADDLEVEAYMRAQGFVRAAEMDGLVLDVASGAPLDLPAGLSENARRHLRKKVLPWDDAYEVELLGQGHRMPTPEELDHFHALYRNVKDRNLALNTFELPRSFFDVASHSPAWEILVLRLKEGSGVGPVAALSVSFLGETHYVPHVFGLDYRFVESHAAYRQLLRRTIARGRERGAQRILLGIGATHEKTRFGATVRPRTVYAQVLDSYNQEVLTALKSEATGKG